MIFLTVFKKVKEKFKWAYGLPLILSFHEQLACTVKFEAQLN